MNATEWLLAEGSILVRGEPRRVSELLLAKGGPLFAVDQRRWILQLAERPLRLYDVTDVVPGMQLTVCDALDREAPPVVVRERSGSQASLVGTCAGFRLMAVDDHYELSGAAYPFSRLAGPGVVAESREAVDPFGGQGEQLPDVLSGIVRRAWLRQYLAPPEMPALMDVYSGEPMLLITDHYRVLDWDALIRALQAQDDVEGERTRGLEPLRRLRGRADTPLARDQSRRPRRQDIAVLPDPGLCRPGASVVRGAGGGAVKFLSREISDPKGVLANPPARRNAPPGRRAPDLPPEAIAEAIEQLIHRSYANWTDRRFPPSMARRHGRRSRQRPGWSASRDCCAGTN